MMWDELNTDPVYREITNMIDVEQEIIDRLQRKIDWLAQEHITHRRILRTLGKMKEIQAEYLRQLQEEDD